jgi:hypothetical protein
MRRKILLLSIIVLIVVVIGAFAGYTYWIKMFKVGVLGEAQIVVYEKGKKTVLDPDSPYFIELQLACEEMLELKEDRISSVYFLPSISDSYLDINHPIVEKLRNEEWVIELIYTETQRIYPHARKTPLLFSHLLIPLTGEFTFELYGDKRYTRLFPLLSLKEIVYYYSHDNEIVVHPHSIGTTKNVQKIKNILEKFNIQVP